MNLSQLSSTFSVLSGKNKHVDASIILRKLELHPDFESPSPTLNKMKRSFVKRVPIAIQGLEELEATYQNIVMVRQVIDEYDTKETFKWLQFIYTFFFSWWIKPILNKIEPENITELKNQVIAGEKAATARLRAHPHFNQESLSAWQEKNVLTIRELLLLDPMAILEPFIGRVKKSE